MKIRMVIILISIFMVSVYVFAEDAPKVYSDDDLKNYGSSSGSSSDRYYQDKSEERYQYYQDKKGERDQYYQDKKETQQQSLRETSNSIEEREKRREACRSEAKSKQFWCPATDKHDACKTGWTNAYRDCNFID